MLIKLFNFEPIRNNCRHRSMDLKKFTIGLLIASNLCFVSLGFPVDPNGMYDISWEVDETKSEIIFEVTVQSQGYVGVGFSSNPSMSGADIIVSGVYNVTGESYIEDRHALYPGLPLLDTEQNAELIYAYENDTHTRVKFSRKLNTCDGNDTIISDDTIYLLWSYGETDNLTYHGGNRGSRIVNFLDPLGPSDPDLSMYDVWELRTNKAMPENDTTYWCTIHKSPNVPSLRHIIAFDAIIETTDSAIHTHHMEAYLCHVEEELLDLFESYVGHPGDDCYYPTDINFPGKYCESIAYGWAIGGQVTLFPDHVGFPLRKGEFFKLEVHYNNPESLANVTFDTGLKLYYTEDLREIDAGRFAIGAEVNFTQLIPPKSASFITVAHCHVSCLESVPESGIHLFNFLIHSHLAGRKMKVRHFRNGTELPWLIIDNNYDFNYQATRSFKNEVTLFPGDSFALECEYDSTDLDEVILGGRSTKEEMCMTFLSYYPRIDNLISCNSEPNKEDLLNFFGIQEIYLERPSDVNPIVKLPLPLRGKTISEVANMVNWTEEIRGEYQSLSRYGSHSGYCRTSGHKMEVIYPAVEEFVPEDKCESL